MKRMISVVLSMLAVSAIALAQTPEQTIEKALLAAPRQMKEGATVIKWKSDFTYDTLNRVAAAQTQGTSGSTCWGQSVGYDRYGNLTSTTVVLGSDAEPDGEQQQPDYKYGGVATPAVK